MSAAVTSLHAVSTHFVPSRCGRKSSQGGPARKLDCYAFDWDYVCRLRDGDLATQCHFVAYFGELLSIKLRARLRSHHLVEEVRQETFLRVFSALRRDGIKQPERLGAFVNSTCNHVLFEVYRAEAHNPNLGDSTPEMADSAPGPESRFAIRQKKLLVDRILRELPAREREVIRQIFLEERRSDEVCKHLQVSRVYLRVLLYRAKQRFRAILQANTENPIRRDKPHRSLPRLSQPPGIG